MACLSTCNIGFLLKDVSYLFETSELRNSNIYWGWSRQFAKKIYIFSSPERSTFIHTSQTCLQNNSKILFNISKPICRERDHWLNFWNVKKLWFVEFGSEKVILLSREQKRKEAKFILKKKKLLSYIWFSFLSVFSLTMAFIPLSWNSLKNTRYHNCWMKEWMVNFAQRRTDRRRVTD